MSEELSREELHELVASLREEIARLKEELRRVRRDHHEVPPHYLWSVHASHSVGRGQHLRGGSDQQGARQGSVLDRGHDRRGSERRCLE